MSQLVIPRIKCVESRDNFASFLAEPLERGFGVTLGNALRRVLLGYLPGAAVTRVKIEGIQHEFSTIPHLKEDATEFLLNVKTLRLKPLSGRPGKLTLEVAGEGRVCAADIKPSSDFEIVNPELYLATLDSPEARLYVEFDVELGIGYKQAESSDNLPIGTIPLDAIFTPIRKVNFTVEPTHVGRETSQEQLSLEVWTDGTISPIDAISQSANVLTEQLAPFADYARISQIKIGEEFIRLPIPEEKYNIPVEQLNLTVRTMNCLRRASITTVGEIITKGEKELMKLRNFGQKSKQEIEERLNGMGLSLTPQVEERKRRRKRRQKQIWRVRQKQAKANLQNDNGDRR
ncbi:MAG: DNA-directed RNA polymerase subunit alpha [Dehalococcoidales bacterium]